MRTPDDTARRILFRAGYTALGRMTGTCRQTMKRRETYPGTITLDELAYMAKGQDITDEELITVIRHRTGGLR